MKLFVVTIFALLAISVHAEEELNEVDWANVLPVQDMPGFWDGREIRPAVYPGDQTRTGRIVGGQIVTPNSHPYQAGLLISFPGGTGLCGGSLIWASRILTAAHCLVGSSRTQVVLGAHTLTATEPSQERITFEQDRYRIHAQYNPSNFQNDIATLSFMGSINETPQIRQIRIPNMFEAEELFVGELATVTGWGRTSDGSSATSAQLRSVQNNVITNAQCAATFGGTIIGSTICISTAGGRGTCNGML
jgi:chymotrypsin